MTDNANFEAYKEKINEMLENGYERKVDPIALPNPDKLGIYRIMHANPREVLCCA